ncbi:hypothetical protein AACH06_14320 [Ideonella sp. DXS29W]|uniref:Secreted protein n=1 Tax=Ideonella lacteola TaxID=2984193 RepID=A0ABU9BQG7_9BURK
MKNSSTRLFAALAAAAALSVTALGAQAATLKIKCEKRSDRSKASVDVSALGCYYCGGQPGDWYTTVLTSGGNSAQSAAKQEVLNEVEFDFDSNPRNIRQGATAISKGFIVDGTVTATLLDASGATVTSATATCRVR